MDLHFSQNSLTLLRFSVNLSLLGNSLSFIFRCRSWVWIDWFFVHVTWRFHRWFRGIRSFSKQKIWLISPKTVWRMFPRIWMVKVSEDCMCVWSLNHQEGTSRKQGSYRILIPNKCACNSQSCWENQNNLHCVQTKVC